jgi:hypothetical protein
VGEDQRYPVPAPGALVDEVDPDAVELDLEVVEPVQLALTRAPVELLGPVGEQVAQVLQVRALLPGSARRRIGPAGVADPRPEIGQDLLVDLDREALRVQGPAT